MLTGIGDPFLEGVKNNFDSLSPLINVLIPLKLQYVTYVHTKGIFKPLVKSNSNELQKMF